MIRCMRWLMGLAVLLATPLAHAGTKHYYYTDPQGTPLAKADAQGNVVARYEYTPYGVAVPSVGAAPDGVGYTGHVNDPESGFVYMQARYYDPMVGRFLSVDPIRPSPGNGFSFNRYTYVNNNPVMHVDPTGMACGGNGEVSDAVQRMRDTSDKCDQSSGSEESTAQDDIENCRTAGCTNRALVNAADSVGKGASDVADFVEEQTNDTVKYWWAGGVIGRIFGGVRRLASMEGALWSSTRKASSIENALRHWNKHRAEFPELANSRQYVEAARALAANPPAGVLIKVRGADTLIYDQATNTFLVRSADGVPRTMFRPADGINYWNKQ